MSSLAIVSRHGHFPGGQRVFARFDDFVPLQPKTYAVECQERDADIVVPDDGRWRNRASSQFADIICKRRSQLSALFLDELTVNLNGFTLPGTPDNFSSRSRVHPRLSYQ